MRCVSTPLVDRSLKSQWARVQNFSRPVPLHAVNRPPPSFQSVGSDDRLKDRPSFVFKGQATAAGEGMTSDKTRISKTDEQFAEKGLEFVEGCADLEIRELNNLFEKVGFPRRDPAKIAIALANTYHVIWVRATKQSRLAKLGQMVGFARATSDGVLSATIWDVAVLPAWQRIGLGRALMERVTERLVLDEIPTITLYAEPVVVTMYEKLGFTKDPEGIRGMAFQRRKKDKAKR
eukprot:gene9764-7639_t